MKIIKFNDTSFSMPYSVVKEGATIRIEVLKEDYTLPQIMPLISDVEEIQVMEDGEVVAVYTGYTEVVCLQIFNDYPIGGENRGYVISMVLANADIQAQVDSLSQQVSSLEETQTEQANAIEELTPYTETNSAYFGETEKTFYNVPEGNISVFFDNYDGDYSISRVSDRVTVSFDPLEQETNITIKVE